MGAVERLAQRAVVGIGLHRQVAGHVQGQLPALAAIPDSRGAGVGEHVGRQPGQFRLVFDIQGERVGGIEHVLREPGRQRRQLLLDLREARLAGSVELGAPQAEITQCVVQHLAPGRVERRGLRRCRQCLVLRIQRRVLRHRAAETADPGQVGVIGLAQFRRVGHRLQVGDLAPCAVQALGGVVQRGHEGLPAHRRHGFGGLHRGFGLGQQGVDGRGDVAGTDLVETRQAGEVEQGVGIHGRSWKRVRRGRHQFRYGDGSSHAQGSAGSPRPSTAAAMAASAAATSMPWRSYQAGS